LKTTLDFLNNKVLNSQGQNPFKDLTILESTTINKHHTRRNKKPYNHNILRKLKHKSYSKQMNTSIHRKSTMYYKFLNTNKSIHVNIISIHKQSTTYYKLIKTSELMH
jgi:hypothetical protein